MKKSTHYDYDYDEEESFLVLDDNWFVTSFDVDLPKVFWYFGDFMDFWVSTHKEGRLVTRTIKRSRK